MTDNGSYPNPAEIRHTIGAGGRFTLNNVSGDITIRGVDGDEIVVRAQSERGRSDGLPLTVTKADGSLSVSVDQSSFGIFGGWFGNRGAIEFEVSVPRTARVEISAVSSEVTARELAGEQSFKTVSGDVDIDSEGGRLRITTVSGDIQIRSRHPVEASASSTSGDVRVSGAVLQAFEARTVSGDIDLRAGLSAGQLHSVETVSGDLSVDSTTGVTVDVKKSLDFGNEGDRELVAGDGSASLRFRTLSGDVRLAGQRRRAGNEQVVRHGRHQERAPEHQAIPSDPDEETTEFDPFDNGQPAQAPEQRPMSQLDVLQALERGEIDVDEASRRLEEVSHA